MDMAFIGLEATVAEGIVICYRYTDLIIILSNVLVETEHFTTTPMLLCI